MKIHFEGSTAHWGSRPWTRGGVHHGPKTWPWWRLVSLDLVKLSVHSPSWGRRLWAYTRWGALFVGFVIDNRKPESR